MNRKILGIGNAIVDVFAKVDDEFLIKRKLIKGSMKLISKSEFEDLKKNIKIEKVVAGGSVANTMSGIAYLKGSPSFIGKINSDSFGEIYKKSLEDINVKFPYVQKNEDLYSGDIVDIPQFNPHKIEAIKESTIIEISTHHEDSDSYRIAKGDSQK
jgi:sugar/nucleoside kinase (ribokinase family)